MTNKGTLAQYDCRGPDEEVKRMHEALQGIFHRE